MAIDLESLTKNFPDLSREKQVAVALSGGPDSMALASLLHRRGGPCLHALTVDHGLRPESSDEAQTVGIWLKNWPNTHHRVLAWTGPKPAARIQEEARKARYRLLAGYCRENAIRTLFLAHHRDDQAETFLFRLAKGSGLDGLACMKPAQDFEGLTLFRPLLETGKAELVTYCREQGLPFIDDPSNAQERFARVRLRRSMEALAAEGLTSERLSTTAQRLARARAALETYAEQAAQSSLKNKDTDHIVYNLDALLDQPDETVLRVAAQAIAILGETQEHGPRTTRLEDLAMALRQESRFRKRTLGGVIIRRDDRAGEIIFEKEDRPARRR